MNSTTLMDNLLFWSIVIPVIWLVWESHKPTVYYRAYLSLIKRNYSPILAMWRAKRTRSARKA
ncbi:hypothetical protein P3521_20100 [Vibrio parahaemolyticus]|uniref:hypothetical protein n=1 Tax=Vibrio parahaemolyticus TaxID=670 RepID=UPI001869F4A2|nr:hypothetical protein [Vibrio parahaemolyticus]MBE3793535.1 hypothetical protein [Vibrio parahaemolyticus]MBE3866395.1 hypothetical protein [Vibrio parahaemolyticus]MCZ5880339.1 hypothetical protein [Vibrio parahaemolyticus]MCZ6371772.1 hypothetical protein [Vibrio parahaemolyticus]MDF4424224.1 hypothetical protein [Vibrio parahaemolyticus]